MITQSKWKSPVFWGSLITSMVGLFSAMGFWQWIGTTESVAVKVAGAVIAIVSIVLGDWNNPSSKNTW
jgi:hypothetical protein